MTDIVSPAVRSRMMAGIKGKHTRPEMLIRRGLHARGHRYRLHVKRLPGCPDLVFRCHRAIIQIHGCFWHGHDCALFRLPGTRQSFWKDKITKNRANDHRATRLLLAAGWRVLTIWECALRGRGQTQVSDVLFAAEKWLLGGHTQLELRSAPTTKPR